jgi:HD superfamily phosphohydrolase
MGDKRSYNLPGYGLVEYQLYPHAQKVFDLLEGRGHIERLRNTDHLGTLRDIFPGAHHTRYEYVIAQLALITELCSMSGPQKEEEFQMSGELKEFDGLASIEDPPSRGEVLQTLVLAANIGHLPSTFAGERALLYHLRENTDARRAFRKGLPTKEDKHRFDSVLESFLIHRIHYYIALFLLDRYRRPEGAEEVVRYCQSVVRSYLDRSKEARYSENPTWRLYSSIRRFAYLSLDSLYTHIPFSIDLSYIFLSLERYREEVFSSRSIFQDALERLDGVMRDSVYLSPQSLLQVSSTAKTTLQKLRQQDTKGWSRRMRAVLGPSYTKEGIDDSIFSDALRESKKYNQSEKHVSISYEFEPSTTRNPLANTVEEEIELVNSVGKTLSTFGIEWDPNGSSLRIAASIDKDRKERKIAYSILRRLSNIDKRLHKSAQMDMTSTQHYRNNRALTEFAYRTLWGWDYNYRFNDRGVEGDYPLYLDSGTTKIAGWVDEYRESLSDIEEFDEDDIHEYSVLSDVLTKLDYRGQTSVYAGSLEVMSDTDTVVEMDGVVLLLGDDRKKRSCVVVEAKNQTPSFGSARSALKEKAAKLGLSEESCEIERCWGGAYLEICD